MGLLEPVIKMASMSSRSGYRFMSCSMFQVVMRSRSSLSSLVPFCPLTSPCAFPLEADSEAGMMRFGRPSAAAPDWSRAVNTPP